MEWVFSILKLLGYIGFIILVVLVCMDGYLFLWNILVINGDLVISNFNDCLSKLFDGIEYIRLLIIFWKK